MNRKCQQMARVYLQFGGNILVTCERLRGWRALVLTLVTADTNSQDDWFNAPCSLSCPFNLTPSHLSPSHFTPSCLTPFHLTPSHFTPSCLTPTHPYALSPHSLPPLCHLGFLVSNTWLHIPYLTLIYTISTLVLLACSF